MVSDYNAVKEVYAEAGELGIALPVFCAEDRETVEAVLASAFEMGQRTGVENLPIVISWTSRYPGRSQMKLIIKCGNPILGTQMMFSDLELFTGHAMQAKNLLMKTSA